MKRLLATVWLLLASVPGSAAVTITMIDLPIPGSPRMLDVRPDNAIATRITIPGRLGVHDIVGNAMPASLGGQCGQRRPA